MKKNILPIDAFREQILESIKQNPVTVIVAETGAGKSTQVPQYLLEDGYDLIVTQPRRLAARSVATRVAYEMGEKVGQTIGYRTAVDRVDSPQTRCLFCTDGLALVRELMGQNKGILVLDEVHEWNENMEVLVAWVKSQIATGSTIKVVLMSATLESEKLSAFFDNAPIISVPGRTFPVEDRMAGGDIGTDIATLVAEGRNVLVFQPGQQEINETISRLEQLKVSAVVLPLHGQLTPDEQAKCFAHYGKPKVVVSTNVAQTSVTIDDIDAVVDSGLERRIELVDGVEGLYLKPISLADAKQRKGRAGRTKAGIYIDHCSSSSRPDFPLAEILRKRLDQTVLRLAIAGFDMDMMDFFHQPAKSDISDARKTLIGLGCMTSEGKVTAIGRLVNKLPVSVKYARMLIEADRLGVVSDVLTVAAIMEMDGITVPPPSLNRPDRPDWRKLVDEKESDIMAQLKVWEMTRTMNETQMKEAGISLRNFFRAKEIRQRLADALKGHFRLGTNGKRENILKAVCAGMVDHLYKNQYGSYRNGDDVSRELGSASVVERSMPDWVVGIPFDLQIQTRRGSMTLNLVSMASKVEPSWLAEIAPHLVSKEIKNLHWDSVRACVVEDHITIFNGQEIARVSKPALWSAEAFKIFVNAMMSTYTSSEVVNELYRSNSEILSQYNTLYIRSGGTISKKDSDTIREKYAKVLEPYHVLSLTQFETLGLNPEELKIKLSDLISTEEVTVIEAGNPEVIEVNGKEFFVTYSDSWSNFNAKIDVTEEFFHKAKEEELLLPSGREVKLTFNGATRTLSEHRQIIERARLEEIERAQRNLVINFESQISSLLTIPQEEPFCSGGYWGGLSETGQKLRTLLDALKAEMIEGLTLENSAERVEILKVKAEEIKIQLYNEHKNAQAFIVRLEESFDKTLSELGGGNFIRQECEEIRNQIYQASNALQKAEFVEVEKICRQAEGLIVNLSHLFEVRQQERNELIKSNNVPDRLLEAFSGDIDRTLEFIANVAKIETWRLDEHELTCGRSRSRANCEEAWSAMGEDSDFFCGADPNDVKYYVYEYHFGENATPVARKEERGSYNNNLSNSNDTMAEALRKAGLI
ncbi:MAG: helicase-related protein [Patescibacteria group bacterium]